MATGTLDKPESRAKSKGGRTIRPQRVVDLSSQVAVSGAADRRIESMTRCIREAGVSTVFISDRQDQVDDLLKATTSNSSRKQLGKLVSITPLRPSSRTSLGGIFKSVVGANKGDRWLPRAQLLEAINDKDAAYRFIGGAVDLDSETVALVRGNFETVVLSFSHFKPCGDGIRPDFKRLSFDDYGDTVVFGEYEASADGILYEIDPRYRRKLNQLRRVEERGFGPALRRLRIQRGLRQSDFAGVSEKTIARLEKGETEKPIGRTLDLIARRLGVEPDEIESF